MSIEDHALDRVFSQIEEMKRVTGATTDVELAEILGLQSPAISKWKKRGSVPDKILRRMDALVAKRRMYDDLHARLAMLDSQVRYHARMLALFLAPSRDSVGGRIPKDVYIGTLQDFTSYFDEITMACAELIQEEKAEGGTTVEAFERMTRRPPGSTFDYLMQRAMALRYGLNNSDEIIITEPNIDL